MPTLSRLIAIRISSRTASRFLRHCQVCKEFHDTPMITTRSHSFCLSASDAVSTPTASARPATLATRRI
ncbi:uncharacterized protein BDZ99DRAFT_467649, partial [Mytilinidion resinicola]